MGLLKSNLALRQNLKWQFQILIAPDYKKNMYRHCLFRNINKIKIIKTGINASCFKKESQLSGKFH
jgi:hypothetical protein